jgi:hypothetical protein
MNDCKGEVNDEQQHNRQQLDAALLAKEQETTARPVHLPSINRSKQQRDSESHDPILM